MFGQLALMDWGSGRYHVDIDYLRVDVVEAATLGETDLLRALHRLPGVSAEDDWSAEPWTRGSRWDETRVYFDGMPVYDPFHGGGSFTSVSPDGIGTLTFHPGVRPVDVGAENRVMLFAQTGMMTIRPVRTAFSA